MIKQVSSFRSSDGVLHENKVLALDREYQIELRGAIQKIVPPQTGKISFTPLEIANLLKTHSREFVGIMKKYDIAIARATNMPKDNK